jgi:hypothetical protein
MEQGLQSAMQRRRLWKKAPLSVTLDFSSGTLSSLYPRQIPVGPQIEVLTGILCVSEGQGWSCGLRETPALFIGGWLWPLSPADASWRRISHLFNPKEGPESCG